MLIFTCITFRAFSFGVKLARNVLLGMAIVTLLILFAITSNKEFAWDIMRGVTVLAFVAMRTFSRSKELAWYIVFRRMTILAFVAILALILDEMFAWYIFEGMAEVAIIALVAVSKDKVTTWHVLCRMKIRAFASEFALIDTLGKLSTRNALPLVNRQFSRLVIRFLHLIRNNHHLNIQIVSRRINVTRLQNVYVTTGQVANRINS